MTAYMFGLPMPFSSSPAAEREQQRAGQMFSQGLPYVPSPGATGDIMGDIFNPSEVTSTQAPWGPQQPYLEDLFSQARSLYQTGGALAPDLSPETQYALAMQQAAAGYNPYLSRFAQGVEGLTGFTNPYAAHAGGISTLNPITQAFGGYLGQAPQTMDPESAALLRETATGQYLGSNPYLSEAFRQAAGEVGQQFRDITMPGISSTFAQAGRFGSPAQQEATQRAEEALGKTLGNLGTQFFLPAYESERSRQEAAKMGLADVTAGGLGRGLTARGQTIGGLGALGGLYSTGIGQDIQKTGLAGDLYGRQAGTQLQALGMLPTARDMQLRDVGLLRDVGSVYDELARTQAMDPWRQLGLYQGAVTGNYGGTTTGPGPSAFERGLGIASDVAGLFSPFYMPSPMQSPTTYPTATQNRGLSVPTTTTGYGADPYQYAYKGPYSRMYGGY